ncbi:hypothetical protein ODJ79_18650 [Actinoplanes sp. KI2]|uniref:hypothetical protein n=1 Tax=Actinoplanes sp. KI2 TaxID=2983315 RepID=UPI0021D5C882|nr:hypothetical protein [Actinoplanes sp. KI2]MCU7725754.1 hypothetical protein [Actinoplanes sp. KI2]
MTQPSPGQTGTNQPFAPAIMGAFQTGVSVLESGIESVRREWNNLINAINGFFARVQQALENDSWWGQLTEWWTDDIRDGIARIRELIEQARQQIDGILQTLEKAVNGSVPVLSLFDVGLAWATKVDTPLSDISPDLSPSGAIDNWRGPAHETYKTRVQDQTDAVDAVVGKVKATSLWLSDVAKANTAYIVELADRVAELTGTLVAIVTDVGEAAAGDLPAVQGGALHLSEFFGTVTTQMSQYLTNLANRLADVLQQITQLAAEYGDHTGLPQGRWPQAVNG